ncbi:16S rRNA (cytosine(967)-C(5))-methyltransferase RsmB [Spiroplasma poulsonii]|uniref:16S rRNA (cytosine(967)-C(5))-methyltransferase n=1 Tax=Spiroplasma poulsonii TaxID=2138 RepID=A0A433ESH2_9MOLU|nr:16S rRNA (cytosine(967)-C(5))-methyltransferase RsmB [Spiroplasma poulsonii]MBW3058266.1 16S rRNA (cytosine(967)-C(5))-methyltransferase RsmB [Spiroplasma poulsonii]RUP77618.1 16S rRNA (cytosine(967)-C(5))-methyltransferase RsmB [Spiroplasma poulsonii]
MRARELAWDILWKVFAKNKFSNHLLAKTIELNASFTDQDKTLAYRIVYGTLKNKLYLEYIANQFIDNRKTNQKLQVILWMSIYQFRFLDRIPNYAIVNEAVNIGKKLNPKYAGFVNATLKKIFESKEDIFEIKLIDETKKLSIKYSFPLSLYLILRNEYNEEVARKVMEDNLTIPKIAFRVNTLKITQDELLTKYAGYNLTKSVVSPVGVIAEKPVINSEMFEEGLIFIQDEMSMRIAEVLDPQETDRVLDMCSAPGGKTTHLSQLMNNKGIIDACDISERKLNLIKTNAKRLGITNIYPHLLDARKITASVKYDKILCDAPCSGLGVIKRKPEIKYHSFTNEKLANLVEIQEQLLEKAYELLKPGGILVYSTCTFEVYENNLQIRNFLAKYNDLEIIATEQTFGYENNTDGFYYCKIRKKDK